MNSMDVKFQLSEKDIEEIKNKALEQIVRNLTEHVKSQINTKQIVAEVKNIMAQDLKQRFEDRVMRLINADEVVEGAVQRVNTRITKHLDDLVRTGLTVTFKGLGSQDKPDEDQNYAEGAKE